MIAVILRTMIVMKRMAMNEIGGEKYDAKKGPKNLGHQ